MARASDLEQMVTAGEAASSAALAALAERSAKLEQTERDLDDKRRALHALSEQLPAIRTEFASRETRLREVEQQHAALNDHCALLTQENDVLRTRIEELVVNASKLSRQLSELRDERDEIKGLLRELETSLDHETAAHAKLKAAHFEAIEAQRLSEANLQEKLSATTTRLEAAERCCHVAVRRKRSVGASRIIRPLRPRPATCSWQQRETRGAFGPKPDGVGH